ncbi:MAG: ABC transporter ATP-binding protein [Acidobacteria bacterium]|nr:ABC transporter ATP-binding protein [Acidobacteriota bacterium]
MNENVEYAVEMRNITKCFGSLTANDKVSLKVRKGSIHAIVGENGAGKSTIMNVLYGFYRADEGEILINNQPSKINSTHDAIALGLGMVHQHFMLAGALSVTENIILGSEPTSGPMIDYKAAKEKIKSISSQYGLQVNPEKIVENLSVGEEQRVEILKTLYRGAKILILDEPTAVLTPQETEEFFTILRALKNQGKTIIIITHKLAEVLAISEKVTVMRLGKVVGEVETKNTSAEELAKLMVGREVLLRIDKSQYGKPREENILSIKNLSLSDTYGANLLSDISFDIKAGEVFGIAGVEGNGQTELVEVLSGLRPPSTGTIALQGQDITACNSRQAKELHIGHIPEDRHKRGLLLNSPLTENAILGLQNNTKLVGWPLLKENQITSHTKKLIQEFDVRPPDPDIAVRGLSGGNQQKLIIAREFSIAPKFLIASQPTRGVDIGAIEFIYKKILELKASGAAVLLVSAELDEVFSLSDRVAVLYEGKIVGIVEPEKISQQEIGLMMTGGKKSQTSKT